MISVCNLTIFWKGNINGCDFVGFKLTRVWKNGNKNVIIPSKSIQYTSIVSAIFFSLLFCLLLIKRPRIFVHRVRPFVRMPPIGWMCHAHKRGSWRIWCTSHSCLCKLGIFFVGLLRTYISWKNCLMPSSFFWVWSIRKRIRLAVTNADTNHSLNLSTICE
jgi:hypothetical protein